MGSDAQMDTVSCNYLPAATAHLKAALEEVHQRWKENILFRLAHFKDPKRVITLLVHVHRQQHGAVNTTPLCIRYPQVHALIVCLHIVAELRLHPSQHTDVMMASINNNTDLNNTVGWESRTYLPRCKHPAHHSLQT